ncbi:MAG: ADP-glyceromanno-heptose 6-epimerase [Candidatus Methylomirabilales bacterium]
MPAARRKGKAGRGVKLTRWRHIVVTGGAGFIGSNLVQELGRRLPEARLTVIDDFRSGSFHNLLGFHGDVLAADLTTLDLNERFAGRPADVIFHLASITDTTVTDERQMLWANVEGFRSVLSYASQHRIPVVYASSAAVYGIGTGKMAEDRSPAPQNIYAFSKCILDNLAAWAAADGTLPRLVGVRYFNVYGPGEAHKGKAASMIYQLACQIAAGGPPRVFTDGEQRRDFVYIADAVEGTILAAQAPRSAVYNIGSGRASSFNEVIALLNHAYGTHYAPEYFENPYPFYQPHTEADLSRACTELGYQPQFPIEKGIAEYVAVLRSR